MNAPCTAVMYHYVRDTQKTDYPAIKALSIADFERQLDWLQENFDVLHFPDFESAVQGKKTFSKPTALLTFDDGFIDHHTTVFPIFQRRGISGVFFVVDATLREEPLLLNVHKTHFLLAKLGAKAFEDAVKAELQNRKIAFDRSAREGIYRYDRKNDFDVKKLLNYELPFDVSDDLLENLFRHFIGDSVAFAKSLYLSPRKIREMAKAGMTFGPHTRSHRVLSRLSPEEQQEELQKGAGMIRELTGQTSIPFCYPYGHPHTYTQATQQILEETGHSVAFNTVRAPVRFGVDAPFALPRYDTKDLPPFVSAFPPDA